MEHNLDISTGVFLKGLNQEMNVGSIVPWAEVPD